MLGTPRPVGTQPTVCSSSSNLDSLQVSASASVLSQQTSASSSIFPPSSISSSPTSVVSEQSSKASSAARTAPTPTGTINSSSSSPAKPQSPASAKKQQSKFFLTRPFGRASLPTPVLPWAVDVSPAEWDNSERRWRYRIQVTKRQPQQQKTPSTPSSSVAVTWRSMESFVWLEQALNAEFQGGLVLPLLSIAVGMTDLDQATHEVDANLLRDWLSDVLNGIRGQGELILGHKSVDLLRSEAVEAFLYRNKAPLQTPGNLISSMMGEAFVVKQEMYMREKQQQRQQQHRQKFNYDEDEEDERNCQNAAMCKPSPRYPHSPSTIYSRQKPDERESFASSFWSKEALALITDELCTGMGCQGVEDSPSSTGSSISSPSSKKYDRLSCASRALGTADTLDIQDSFLDASTIVSMQSSRAPDQWQKQTTPANKPSCTWKLAQSTSLIQAERRLALSYRKTALSTMEKVQVLVEEEEHIGLAWKRFGIAVNNLFTYEKEVENARLGEKKIHRDAMPYRKVKKSTVDQCIRALTQQKIDRSLSAPRLLRSMLTAYVADLSAVSPSVDAYLEGMTQMAAFDEYFEAQSQHGKRNGRSRKDGSSTGSTSSQISLDDDHRDNGKTLFGSLSEQIRSFTAPSRDEGQKEKDILRTSSSTSSTETTEEDGDDDEQMPAPATEMHKKRLVEDRVMANERLLRESLTTLCKSTTMRSSRMAYAYFNFEAKQCSLLRSAAASLRSKIDLSNKEAVAQMISRHQSENKEDMKTELALAQRIVNLGGKKYSKTGEEGDDEERAISLMRDNALQVARERVGRWNSELAMSIMKAVGVNDPNVRVEETTRELRLVRKYAIGLRENLNKCIEAVDLLRNAVLKGGRQDLKGVDKRKKSGKHISETRKEYFAEVAKLFSGIIVEPTSESPKSGLPPPSPKALTNAGIKLSDPLGWSTPFAELSSKAIPVSILLARATRSVNDESIG